MSNTLNQTLASVLVAAAAFGGTAANAQSSRQADQDAAKDAYAARVATCYEVGKAKGTEVLQFVNKAIQQDREKGVGCIFMLAAGGEPTVQVAADLNDPRQATAFAKSIDKLRASDDKIMLKQTGKAPTRDEQGNVVQETAREATDTARDANKTLKEGNKAIKEGQKLLKGLGIKF